LQRRKNRLIALNPQMPSILHDKPELIETVLQRMADGEVLSAVCDEMGFSISAFSHYCLRNEELAARYTRAREMQAASMASDVVRIADEDPDPQRARVRTDARKWLAARIDPRNYGDRSQVAHTGADGGPIEIVSTVRAEQAAAQLTAAFDAIEHKP
jgi:hypothetical protein